MTGSAPEGDGPARSDARDDRGENTHPQPTQEPPAGSASETGAPDAGAPDAGVPEDSVPGDKATAPEGEGNGPGRAPEAVDNVSEGTDGAGATEGSANRATDGAGAGAGGAAPGGTSEERPEERLERAVRAAEQALIEYEIAIETFRIEVENFSRLHHQKLGPMYARLDELDAQIAEAKAARTGDPQDIQAAKEARARVMPIPSVSELFHDWMDSDGLSPDAAAMLTGQPVRPPERVRPSAEARKLYRELARKAHPDLAQDEKERAVRDEFIARVNTAYSRGDEALLRELAEEWERGFRPTEPQPSRSEELYARLEWLAQRKELLTVVARELEESAIGAMLRMAPEDPDGLLNEIAEQLLAEVAAREAELARLCF